MKAHDGQLPRAPMPKVPPLTPSARACTAREISAAPSLGVELGVAAGIFLTVIALRWAQPWLMANVPLTIPRQCSAPADERNTRLVFLNRRGDEVVVECGPLVGSRERKHR